MSRKTEFGGVKVVPDKILSKIVGSRKISPSQLTKKLWSYIKRHKLFEGQKIIPDENLSKIVGNRKVKNTDFNKKVWNYIKKHGLLEGKHAITTIVDDFYDLLLKRGELGLFEASVLLGVPTSQVEEWAIALERAGFLKVVYTPFGIKFKKVVK